MLQYIDICIYIRTKKKKKKKKKLFLLFEKKKNKFSKIKFYLIKLIKRRTFLN